MFLTTTEFAQKREILPPRGMPISEARRQAHKKGTNAFMRQPTAAQFLRELMQQPDMITLPCCFDAFSAKLIELAGFKSTFISGFASIAARYGLLDMGLISFGEAVEIARPILNNSTISTKNFNLTGGAI